MKKIKLLAIMILGLILLTGCNNKYKGYWCNYEDTATIVVLLEDNITDTQKANLESKIDEFDNIKNRTEYSKEDYEEQIDGENDLHAAYVITFSSHDFIGDYVEQLSKLPGVYQADQETAKTNLELYNLKNGGKYTFTNSDEAEESELETGKYKIKKGVITFTPKDSKNSTKLLYIKNDLLCKDADCTKIFAKSDNKCQSKK